MKRLIIPFILICSSLFISCEDHLVVEFDTPFVSITDDGGSITEMTIDKDANNLLTELTVRLCVSSHYFQNPVTVDYKLVCGDGLTQDVDFKVQPTTASPLTFPVGEYYQTIRIMWYKSPSFDPSKDNTLRVQLSGCNLKNAVMGYPGKDHLKSEFIFTKQ